MRKTLHFIVSGRVQGVFFRLETKKQAELHNLGGWVRNLPDGRVEGMACGETEQLETFKKWLSRGPQMAQVTNLELEQVDNQEFDGFKIRYL